MNFSIAEYSAMIYYILTVSDMVDYAVYFATHLCLELLIQKIAWMDRNHKKGNVFHCEEDVSSAEIEKHRRWLREFWQQMLLESQRKKLKIYLR